MPVLTPADLQEIKADLIDHIATAAPDAQHAVREAELRHLPHWLAVGITVAIAAAAVAVGGENDAKQHVPAAQRTQRAGDRKPRGCPLQWG